MKVHFSELLYSGKIVMILIYIFMNQMVPKSITEQKLLVQVQTLMLMLTPVVAKWPNLLKISNGLKEHLLHQVNIESLFTFTLNIL